MTEEAKADVLDVVVTTRGDIGDDEREYGRAKVERLVDLVDRPVLFARLDLDVHGDPAREQPAFAKAELDLDGHVVRAHATASTMLEAIDALDARFRARLERARDRTRSLHLRHRDDSEHQWRHGAYSAPRPDFFPRPSEAREIVRHKTFSVVAMTPDEAADDLERLDHEFFLFRNVETDEDNVIARSATEPDAYELLEPAATCSLAGTVAAIERSPLRPAPMTVEAAREALDLTQRPFVFFLDEGRGRVLYRRYDGHYGLILPADATG